MSDPQQSARAPLGEPLRWSDEELDALSAVSPQDVAEAQGWVAKNAGDGAALWEAIPDEAR
jgi:hypothetical protein